jgi:hypothetical protein
MAGANNAQMKSAGWRASDITKARAERGGLSHSTMVRDGFPPKKGADPGGRWAAKTAVAQHSLRSLAGAMMARRKAATVRAAPALGPAQQRLQNLRSLRQDADATRAAWRAEARKANPSGDIATFTPAMERLGKRSSAARDRYDAANMRSSNEFRQKRQNAESVMMRYDRAARSALRKAGEATGDKRAALEARAKQLLARRDAQRKVADRYDTLKMSHDRFRRVKGV